MVKKNIVVIGGGGAIGGAFIRKLSKSYEGSCVYCFSSAKLNFENVICNSIDYNNEDSIFSSANLVPNDIDLIIVSTGILHSDGIMPEKSLNDITRHKLITLFNSNTVVPTLIAKHFIPKLSKSRQSSFCILSARVGSISDNYLGGWYSYRASKCALNMIIKSLSIELSRKNKLASIIGIHPGTVNSELSKPFQKNILENKLFSPDFAVENMIKVIKSLDCRQSGKIFAWDGSEIKP